jgi:hypothetical protein
VILYFHWNGVDGVDFASRVLQWNQGEYSLDIAMLMSVIISIVWVLAVTIPIAKLEEGQESLESVLAIRAHPLFILLSAGISRVLMVYLAVTLMRPFCCKEFEITNGNGVSIISSVLTTESAVECGNLSSWYALGAPLCLLYLMITVHSLSTDAKMNDKAESSESTTRAILEGGDPTGIRQAPAFGLAIMIFQISIGLVCMSSSVSGVDDPGNSRDFTLGVVMILALLQVA